MCVHRFLANNHVVFARFTQDKAEYNAFWDEFKSLVKQGYRVSSGKYNKRFYIDVVYSSRVVTPQK